MAHNYVELDVRSTDAAPSICYRTRAYAAGAELLEKVEATLPVVTDHAGEVETLGKAHPSTIQALETTGLFRALTPMQYGGLECDPASFFEACVRISARCGSSGWVAGLVHSHSWQIALMDKRMQDEFWAASPDARASSSYAATGTVKTVKGGFELSGTWGFSSGIDYSDWVILGGVIRDAADGEPDARSFVVPKADFVVDQNSWNVVGLRGSGSKAVTLDRAFVPAYRTHSVNDVYARSEAGFSENDRPLYRLPWMSMFYNCIASVALGTGVGGVEAFKEDVKTRVSMGGAGMAVATDPFLHLRLASALSDLDNVHRRLLASWRDMFETTCRGEEPDRITRTRSRFEGADTTATAFKALSEVYEASGGGAVQATKPVQRYFRDLMAMRNHPTATRERFASIYVQAVLGLDPGPFSKAAMASLVVHA